MSGLGSLVAATIAFVGMHFILSHPLRKPLVSAMGERPFLGLYALVAAGTLAWMVFAYRASPATAPLWDVGDGLWALASVLMLLASILFMGSLIGNPALPSPGAQKAAPDQARDVYAITRHPMMWAFAIWGGCHILVYPIAANIVLAGGIIILAVVGAALQDRKKEQLQPETWPAWETMTSYWPFAAVAAGRARLGGFRPHTLAGGLLVWLGATWVGSRGHSRLSACVRRLKG